MPTQAISKGSKHGKQMFYSSSASAHAGDFQGFQARQANALLPQSAHAGDFQGFQARQANALLPQSAHAGDLQGFQAWQANALLEQGSILQVKSDWP